MNRRSLLAISAMTLLPCAALLAQPPGPGGRKGPPRFNFGKVGNIQKVADDLYMIPGAGGNTTVYVAKQGVVLVDVKVPGSGQGIMDQVKTVTDKPIIYIINTHEHFDHTGSNAFFPAKVKIVDQVNCAEALKHERAFQTPQGKRGLADITYKKHMSLLDGQVELYHFGTAHTNGDTIVVFPKEHVMSVGDVFPSKSQPILDTQHGGSGLHFPVFLEDAAKTIKNVSIVIPGHSPVATWQDFVDYGEFNRLMVQEARKEFKAGKTPVQAMADFKQSLPAKFQGYRLGKGMLTGPGGDFEPLFRELKAQQQK